MINEQICKLRDKLNDSIINGNDYNETYKLSVELDKLIAKFYTMQYDKEKKKRKIRGYRRI